MKEKSRCEHLTDEFIERAFTGTDFGGLDHRKLLEQGCLKAACGFYNGHTLTVIMAQIGLTTKQRGQLTVLGKQFLMEAFYIPEISG